MKRLIAILVLMQSSGLVADTLLGGEVGTTYWNYAADGAFSDSTNLTRFDFNDTDGMVVYASLEHPIPLLPNFKFRNNPVSADGNVVLGSNFSYFGVTFPSGSELNTEADLSHNDLVFYYELLDNQLVSIDLGTNLKWFDGSMSASSLTFPGTQADQKLELLVPMIYGKLRADLWGTGLYGSAEANYVSFSDTQLSDFQVALGYALIENLTITLNVEAGYRVIDMRLDDVDDIYADFKMNGAWLGVALDF